MNIKIYVDGDACPVKDEIYKVAFRYQLPVCVVANAAIRIPRHELISFVMVAATPDAADDYIADLVDENAIVITADIPLADRALKAGAAAIATNGKPFTDASIGSALATRALMQDLRAGGDIVGGPPPFQKSDRSRFLRTLDETIVRLQRR